MENRIHAGEMVLKGTAPSHLNLEADRGKPGPVSPLSAKGYEQIDAYLQQCANVEREAASVWMIDVAFGWLRRERFDLWRAVSRVMADPGIVARWEKSAARAKDRTVRRDREIVRRLERIERRDGPMPRDVAIGMLIERTASAKNPSDRMSQRRIRDALKAEAHRRREEEPDGEEWLRSYALALRATVAQIEEWWPGASGSLYVAMRPDEERARTYRESQKLDTAHEDREIVERLERIQEDLCLGRRDAADVLDRRCRRGDYPEGPTLGYGWRRVRHAIERENRRARDGAA